MKMNILANGKNNPFQNTSLNRNEPRFELNCYVSKVLYNLLFREEKENCAGKNEIIFQLPAKFIQNYCHSQLLGFKVSKQLASFSY